MSPGAGLSSCVCEVNVTLWVQLLYCTYVSESRSSGFVCEVSFMLTVCVVDSCCTVPDVSLCRVQWLSVSSK